MNTGEFKRKKNRLHLLSYVGPQAHFITICAQGRRKAFQDTQLIALSLAVLRETCNSEGFDLYAYCFMPDHVHLIPVGLSKEADLQAFVRRFKGNLVAQARKLGIRNIWQKGFYDHVIRNSEGLDSIAWYIWNNPVRAGFVKNIGDWPYSGSWMVDWSRIRPPDQPFVPPWKMAG